LSEKFLEEILAYKKELVKSRQAAYEIIKEKLKGSEYTHYEIFKKKISEPGKLNLIAEIKKASPSPFNLETALTKLANKLVKNK